jgi:hypothetical protein
MPLIVICAVATDQTMMVVPSNLDSEKPPNVSA